MEAFLLLRSLKSHDLAGSIYCYTSQPPFTLGQFVLVPLRAGGGTGMNCPI